MDSENQNLVSGVIAAHVGTDDDFSEKNGVKNSEVFFQG